MLLYAPKVALRQMTRFACKILHVRCGDFTTRQPVGLTLTFGREFLTLHTIANING